MEARARSETDFDATHRGALGFSDDDRWRAVESRDPRFDGMFIVGVRTTGIYCRPSCPTPVQPLRRNVDFYVTAASAQRQGLRACKRCRPDASPGSPQWNLRQDLVGRAMRMITDGCLDSVSVNELAGSLGVTPRHLRRVMIDEVGAPPIAVARAHRAQTARTLIETTDMTFTDVTFASGFQSQRQFNDTVKAVFAETPTELRAKSRSGIAVSSGELRLRLAHRLPIASAYLLGWAAHRCVAGVSQVDGETLRTALRLPHGGGTVELRFDEGFVDCRLRLDEVRDVGEAVRQCRAMLDLDCDPTAIDAALGALKPLRPLVKSRPGLRSPGSTDGFATLAFAVLGQQRSVAAARTLAGRIVARVRAHAGAGTEELVPFPSPEVLAETDLGDLGLTTRGIHTLHAISRQWAGRTNELSPSGDRNSVRSELLTVSGIGPWTADYVLMRVMADPDIWLGGDLVAARSANALSLRAEELRLISPWRSYATHHLWAASNPESPKD